MIKIISKAFQVGDKLCLSVDDAQKEEFMLLLDAVCTNEVAADVADLLVSQKDKVIDILTTNSNSRPKARKTNGGTKNRKPKEITEAAQTVEPSVI